MLSLFRSTGLNSLLRRVAVLFAFVLINCQGLAQKTPQIQSSLFLALEDSLHRMAMQIIEYTDDQERLQQNTLFKNALEQALRLDSTLSNPFDSVRTVSFLKDPLGKFRIITWYVPLINGTYRYFGFFQTPPAKNSPACLLPLWDRTHELSQPASRELGPDEWFGAWYYELIHQRHRRKDHYILLGWKGNNPESRKRVIEPVSFDKRGLVFGAPVFEMGSSKPYRIIFEYSARVSMNLKYDPRFKQGKRKKRPMIIFDRLVPVHESFRGNFSHYVPEVNVADGFRFKNGLWTLVPDVDARVFIDPALVPLNPSMNP